MYPNFTHFLCGQVQCTIMYLSSIRKLRDFISTVIVLYCTDKCIVTNTSRIQKKSFLASGERRKRTRRPPPVTLVASNDHQLHSPLGTPCHDGDDGGDGGGDDDGGDDVGGGDVVRFPVPLASGGKLSIGRI